MLTKANPHHCSPVLFFIQSPIEVYADFGAIIQWEQCCEQMKKVLIVRRGLAPDVFDRTVSPKFAIMQIWSSLSLVRVHKKAKERSTQGGMPFRLDFKVAQPATKQSTGLFLPNLSSSNLEQLVVGSSP